jgi:hypothetical protein
MWLGAAHRLRRLYGAVQLGLRGWTAPSLEDHNLQIVNGNDHDENGRPILHAFSFSRRLSLRNYLVRARLTAKFSPNHYGTVRYDLNYDAETGLLDVTADNSFYFVGFLSFSPDVELNLWDDIVGGFKWIGNFRTVADA